jgi:tetratricopeptide (TPR) repeat protein
MRFIFYIIFLFAFQVAYAAGEKPIPDFSKVDDEKLTDTLNLWRANYVFNAPVNADSGLILLNMIWQQGLNSRNTQLEMLGRFYLSLYKAEKLRTPGEAKKAEAISAELEKHGFLHSYALTMHEIAIMYNMDNNYAKSLAFQERAYEVYKKLGLENVHELGYIITDLGFLYYHVGNYIKCRNLLLSNVQHLHEGLMAYQYFTLQIHNTIGLSYRDMGKYDSALVWFQRTLDSAQAFKDTSWIGIVSGNIGNLYIQQHQFDIALPYVKTYYDASVTQDRLYDFNIAEALSMWGKICMSQQKTDEAIVLLMKAKSYSDHKKQYSTPDQLIRIRMFTELAKAYILKGNPSNSLYYFSMADSLRRIMQQQNSSGRYSNVQIQLEAEKSLAEIRELEADTRLSIQRRNFSLAALALGGLFVLTLYNRQRLKNRKDRELHQNREQLLHLEKVRAEEQLAGYMENLHEKNRIIEEFETERERLQLMPDSADKLQTIETIEKLQRSTIITEDEWTQFKILFDKVHKGFFMRLKEKYPELTQAEIRLLALTKLNLSTKEMAGILGISPESIRKARYRFLKKVNDTSGEADIPQIVNSI